MHFTSVILTFFRKVVAARWRCAGNKDAAALCRKARRWIIAVPLILLRRGCERNRHYSSAIGGRVYFAGVQRINRQSIYETRNEAGVHRDPVCAGIGALPDASERRGIERPRLLRVNRQR